MASVQQSWSDYWKDGVKTSFGRDLQANYVGILADNWRPFWQQAQNGSRVLDVACGNGALSELCFQALLARDLAVTVQGIDYAAIVEAEVITANTNGLPQVCRLQGNTDFLHLDPATTSFDLLISQFGFEYIERHAAIQQLATLLKPQGQFRFVCHFYDSAFIRENQLQLQMNQFVDDENGLVKLKAMLDGLAQVKDPQQLLRGLNAVQFQPVVAPVKTFTQAAMAKFGERFLSAEFMNFFRFIWSDGLSLDVAARAEAFAQFAAAHNADTMRLHSMVNAAFTQHELSELPALFHKVGCTLLPYNFIHNEAGEAIAVVLQGEKTA